MRGRRRSAFALAVGVSTVQRGLSTLGGAYREASQALRRVAESGGVLSLPDLSAFEYLTLRDDEVARRLIAPEIERFVAEDRAHGGQLIDTLLAYAEADLNAKAAAETLLIHVNTAHYRLGRIAEKTGCDLRRLSDVIDLLIAVRLADAMRHDVRHSRPGCACASRAHGRGAPAAADHRASARTSTCGRRSRGSSPSAS